MTNSRSELTHRDPELVASQTSGRLNLVGQAVTAEYIEARRAMGEDWEKHNEEINKVLDAAEQGLEPDWSHVVEALEIAERAEMRFRRAALKNDAYQHDRLVRALDKK